LGLTLGYSRHTWLSFTTRFNRHVVAWTTFVNRAPICNELLAATGKGTDFYAGTTIYLFGNALLNLYMRTGGVDWLSESARRHAFILGELSGRDSRAGGRGRSLGGRGTVGRRVAPEGDSGRYTCA